MIHSSLGLFHRFLLFAALSSSLSLTHALKLGIVLAISHVFWHNETFTGRMIGSNPSLTITLCARISPKGGARSLKLDIGMKDGGGGGDRSLDGGGPSSTRFVEKINPFVGAV